MLVGDLVGDLLVLFVPTRDFVLTRGDLGLRAGEELGLGLFFAVMGLSIAGDPRDRWGEGEAWRLPRRFRALDVALLSGDFLGVCGAGK